MADWSDNFDSGSLDGDWTVTGTVTASTTQKYSGSYSAYFNNGYLVLAVATLGFTAKYFRAAFYFGSFPAAGIALFGVNNSPYSNLVVDSAGKFNFRYVDAGGNWHSDGPSTYACPTGEWVQIKARLESGAAPTVWAALDDIAKLTGDSTLYGGAGNTQNSVNYGSATNPPNEYNNQLFYMDDFTCSTDDIAWISSATNFTRSPLQSLRFNDSLVALKSRGYEHPLVTHVRVR